MKKSNSRLMAAAAALLLAMAPAQAADTAPAAATGGHAMDYTFGAGFNIGGTTPLGLPASIRSINSYRPTLNLSISAAATRMLSPKWGIGAGITLETKGMKSGIEARNYHLTMNIVSGEGIGTKTGYYTGKIVNKTRMSYATIPVYAVWRPHRGWEFNAGAYFSLAIDRSFIGNVFDGTMREGPLHPLMAVNRAEYDYSSDLRRIDTGLLIGATRSIYRGLGIRATLEWGLLSALNPSTRKIDMNTYNVYLNLSLIYRLGH